MRIVDFLLHHIVRVTVIVMLAVSLASLYAIYSQVNDQNQCIIANNQLTNDKLNRATQLNGVDRGLNRQESELRRQRDLLFGGLLNDLQSPSEGIRKDAFMTYLKELAIVEGKQKQLVQERQVQEEKRSHLIPYPNIAEECGK